MKKKLTTSIPFLLVAAFFGWLMWSHSTALKGSFEAGAELGGWTMTPDTCQSGAREGFHGVTLWESSHPERRLRLVSEPSGTQAVTAFLEDRLVIIPLGECEQATLSLEQTSTVTPDGFHDMSGEIEVTCLSLNGRASFENCKPFADEP